jgi:hypothetical protein
MSGSTVREKVGCHQVFRSRVHEHGIKCPTPLHGRSLELEQMARLEELPLDLLPQILIHLLIPDHLASLCLVSRTVYSFSVPKLYRRIAILPWHKSSKSRVCSIFSEESKIKLTDKSSRR